MSAVLEVIMLVCFGCSWPINLVKNYKCRSAKGMSLPFILFLIIGYVAGICAKVITVGHLNFVMAVYVINLAMIVINLLVYFRNRAFDRKAEGRQPHFSKKAHRMHALHHVS